MQVPNHPTITTSVVLRPTQIYVDLERWAGKIPNEILTNINTRLPRVYLPITLPDNITHDR